MPIKHSNRGFTKVVIPNLRFVLPWLLSLVLFWLPLKNLVSLSLGNEIYSHIILIPFISLSLIYLERARVFAAVPHRVDLGIPAMVFGVIVYVFAINRALPFDQDGALPVTVFAVTLMWMAWFVLCYGTRAFRAAIFPLLFLLLMVPLPTVVMDKAVSALQWGSAEMAYVLFKLAGVPVFRQGIQFSLPGVDIKVGAECSGIRSSLALFITGMLAAHVFLQSGWKPICFSLLTIPVAIFKNAVRIVTISLLGVYVNPDFLHGKLHQYGGLLFSLLGFAILVVMLYVLQRSEIRPPSEPARPDASFAFKDTAAGETAGP